MKRLLFVLTIVSLFFVMTSGGATVFAAGVDGFSGRNYLKMDAPVRTFYVNGFVHGMSIVQPMADENAIVPWLETCIGRMGPVQFEKTLTEYITAHPELQDARLDVLAFLAFKAECRKR